MGGLCNYLLTVRKLNNMGRWSTDFMHQRTTVSEHSFFVAQVGQLLATIEEANGKRVNWERLYKKLLNHDVVEAITGDIISTIKHKNNEMKSMLDLLEKEVAEENILLDIEEPYKDIYRKILLDGKDDTLEGEILKNADNIDAMMECIGEVKLHNRYPFVHKYHSILGKLKESELVSVRYFIAEILPGLISECEELKAE